MSEKKPLKLQAILHAGGNRLGQMVRRAAELGSLLEVVREALPEAAREHVFGVNLRGATLVVLTDSAAWAARMRYCAGAVQRHLAATRQLEVRQVRVKVRAPAAATRSRTAD